jgi:chromate transport protein ChrA
LRIIALLDRSVKRVHLDVDDFAHNYLVTILIPGPAAT